jgi:hypothetical protein
MKLKFKGFKENPLILKEKKIYEHQNTMKVKKSDEMHGSLEGFYLSCIRPGA